MTQIQPEIVYKICDESQWSLLIQPFIRATKQETQRHYRDFLIEAYSIISVTEVHTRDKSKPCDLSLYCKWHILRFVVYICVYVCGWRQR